MRQGPRPIQDGLDGILRQNEGRQIDLVYHYLRDKGYMNRLSDKVRLAVLRKHARRLYRIGTDRQELEALWRECEARAEHPGLLFFWSIKQLLD